MRTIWLTACLITVLSEGTDCAAAADIPKKPGTAGKSFVKLLQTSPLFFRKERVDDKATAVVNVPILLENGLKPDDLATYVRFASFGNREAGQLASATCVKIVPINNAWHLRLRVAIDGSISGKRYGTYQFQVWVIRKEGNVAQEPPLPILKVEYPETKLEPVKTLTFKKQLNILKKNSFKPSKFKLRIQDGLPAESVTVDADPPEGATVEFKNSNTLELHKKNVVNLETSDFPLGSTTFDIAIRSPDFATVKLPVTVEVKRSPTWIIFITLVGIVVGTFLRIRADRLLSRYDLGIRFNTIRADIVKQRGRSGDKDYKQALDDIDRDVVTAIAALKRITDNDELAAAEARVKALETALETAVNDFLTRQNELQKTAGRLSNLTSPSLDLPGQLHAHLDGAHDRLESIMSNISSGKLEQAAVDLDSFQKSLDTSILQFLDAWRGEVQTVLDDWKAIRPVLPKAVLAPFEAGITGFRTKMGQLNRVGDKADAGHWLEIGDAAYRGVDDLVERTIAELCISGKIVLRTLEQNSEIASDRLEPLRDAIDTLEQLTYDEHVSNPLEGLQSVTPRIQTLVTQLDSTISGEVDDAADPATSERGQLKARITTALATGDYESAALALVTLLKTPALQQLAGQPTLQATMAKVPPTAPTRPTSIAPRGLRERKLPSAPFFPLVRVSLARIADDIADSESRIATVKRLRWWIVLVLLCCSAYFLYEKTFIGTPGDFFVVFLWGFTLDVGVNTFVEKAGTVVAAVRKK